jgi:hypothetical protein
VVLGDGSVGLECGCSHREGAHNEWKGNMNTTRADGSKVRTTKGDRNMICGERAMMTITCSLSEGFEERWSVRPTVVTGGKGLAVRRQTGVETATTVSAGRDFSESHCCCEPAPDKDKGVICDDQRP